MRKCFCSAQCHKYMKWIICFVCIKIYFLFLKLVNLIGPSKEGSFAAGICSFYCSRVFRLPVWGRNDFFRYNSPLFIKINRSVSREKWFMLLKVYVLYGMYRCKKSGLNVLSFGVFLSFFLFDFARNLVMHGWICRFE